MTPTDDDDEYAATRLLVLAPTPRDAAMTLRILSEVNIFGTACATVDDLCREIAAGAGGVLLTEEASESPAISGLVATLKEQPPWSDLPVIILAAGGASSLVGRRALERLGNVTVLERPVQMASLVSVVRSLIRARKRQYQIREHLRERENAALALGQSEARFRALAAERETLLNSEQAARGEAERVSRVKDEFLATLSHELRTPLNAILGWALILRSGGGTREEMAEGLETIERNARVQAQIIEDLLDMSRIISGNIRLDVHRVEVEGVVRSALDTVRPAAEAKGIRIDVALQPIPATVSGDPARLQQICWNLLSNAIKFTPKGGRVAVHLARRDSHIEITVSDSGEGIRPEFLPHVFDRFRQADASTTRRHGGLGLGLAIVKQLVELHGGTVEGRSPGPGAGSTFIVSLPMTPLQTETLAQSELRHAPESSRAALAMPDRFRLDGLKLLVVDDEPDSREVIRRLLEDYRATVTTAASAAEAMAAVQNDPPDVLISDIGMPGEDGYSLMKRIRATADPRARSVPAIALTAYARAEDRAAALNCGFQTHLAKPVEPAELIATVAQLGRAAHAQAASETPVVRAAAP